MRMILTSFYSRTALGLALGCFVMIGLWACEMDLMSDWTPAPLAPNEEVSLEAIKKRGVLRVALRNNALSYFVYRGQRMGFDYEMASRLAKQMDVKLEVIVPKGWQDLITLVRTGEADIAAAPFTITEKRSELVGFSHPHLETYIQVVWKKGTKPIEKPSDLSGKTIHIRRHSSYYEALMDLNKEFDQKDLSPIRLRIVPEERETEKILAEVAHGEVDYIRWPRSIKPSYQNWNSAPRSVPTKRSPGQCIPKQRSYNKESRRFLKS